MKITERDRILLENVYRFRVLRSRDHILPLFDDKETILRRAQYLTKEGYLFRFEQPNTYTQHLYGLGNKGAEELRKWKTHLRIARNDWRHHNKRLKESSIDHILLVADIAVGIEVACRRKSDVRYISPEEIFDRSPGPTRKRWYELRRTAADDPYRISASVKWNGALSAATIYADWMFGLELLDRTPSPKVFFFLEADRGTMPVITGKLQRSSIVKKLLVYQAAARVFKGFDAPNVLEKTFGIRGIRTLFVITPDRSRGSTGSERIKSCLKMNRDISRGQGSDLFLFADQSFLENNDPLTARLVGGCGDETFLIK